MPFITRKIILQTLLRHKSLSVKDLAKAVYPELTPDKNKLSFLLHQLTSYGHILIVPSSAGTEYALTATGQHELQRLTKL